MVRLLLIAYEFPPSPSPQSLRWSYLVRELLEQGMEVHVLTVEGWWPSTWAQPPAGAVVHRAKAGGVAGIIALARRWRRLRGRPEVEVEPGVLDPASGKESTLLPVDEEQVSDKAAVPSMQIRQPLAAPVLNWKGRLLERINHVISKRTFPDERGLWEPHGRKLLNDLLGQIRPDVVISSHEPATTLRLGRVAKERGFAWVADLGDPVLSFYTPEHWRKESHRLERWTCRNADRVTVTTEAAKWLLAGRHDVPESRLAVMTQGYDREAMGADISGMEFDPRRLELLYTGSFYQFREPRTLVDAVLSLPGTRLSIATSRAPDWLLSLLDAHPEQLRLLGFLSHAQAVTLQRSADVLVNIANDDPVHVPGKVYEYLGAGRPILHLGNHEDDVAARLIRTHRRGLVSGSGAEAIVAALSELAIIKRDATWDQCFHLDQAGVEQYQWQSIARRLHILLQQVIEDPRT